MKRSTPPLRAVCVLLILSAVALSGCTTDPVCEEEPCDDGSNADATGSPFAETDTLEFFGCSGGFVQVRVPREWLESFYPDHTEPRGTFTQDSATHVWYFMSCERGVVSGVDVIEPVSYVHWSLWTQPQEIYNETLASYTHSSWSDAPLINDWWRERNLTAHDATIARPLELTPTGNGLESWRLVSENATVEWSFDRPGSFGFPNEPRYLSWYGNAQDIMEEYQTATLETVFGIEPTRISITGSSPIAQAFGSTGTIVATANTLSDAGQTFVAPVKGPRGHDIG